MKTIEVVSIATVADGRVILNCRRRSSFRGRTKYKRFSLDVTRYENQNRSTVDYYPVRYDPVGSSEHQIQAAEISLEYPQHSGQRTTEFGPVDATVCSQCGYKLSDHRDATNRSIDCETLRQAKSDESIAESQKKAPKDACKAASVATGEICLKPLGHQGDHWGPE